MGSPMGTKGPQIPNKGQKHASKGLEKGASFSLEGPAAEAEPVNNSPHPAGEQGVIGL